MTRTKNSLWEDFNSPLDEVESTWLRRFVVILFTPAAIFIGMLGGAVYGVIRFYKDCWSIKTDR